MARATPRKICTSSSVNALRLNNWFNLGISLRGACGSRKPMRCSASCQWSNRPCTDKPSARVASAVRAATLKPPSAWRQS